MECSWCGSPVVYDPGSLQTDPRSVSSGLWSVLSCIDCRCLNDEDVESTWLHSTCVYSVKERKES